MKRILVILLAVAMLLPFAMQKSEAEIEQKPFYGLGWSDISRLKFPNLEGTTEVSIKHEDGRLFLMYNNNTDLDVMAETLVRVLNNLPEGMRYIRLSRTSLAFEYEPEAVIFADKGIDILKEQFSLLIQKYHALGGKLDGVVLDTEHILMRNWYIYSKEYYQDGKITNAEIYNQIVQNPKYATEVRPLLEERGFVFWENPEGIKSEIYSIWPYQYLSDSEQIKYANCAQIWNTVMSNRISHYLNKAVYEPVIAYYPNAYVSDYQVSDSDAWLKAVDSYGAVAYLGGNAEKVGNTSCLNTYNVGPSTKILMDTKGNYVYNKPITYHEAVYEDDPYHMFMWDVNRFKDAYAATDNKIFNFWIAEYDYNAKNPNSTSNSPYYAETILHAALLDPKPLLIFMWREDTKFTATKYNECMQVISDILNELTRLAGYADRKPIETPASWNDNFILSGMYANGRNLWRLTPDINEISLADFKVEGEDPTFSVNGKTITFPQGKIIEDGPVSVVGTSGYWIETPATVTPVVTTDADWYKHNPTFSENFESYGADTAFTDAVTTYPDTWSVSAGTQLLVKEHNGNKALALAGTAKVSNQKVVKNVTAGDGYAKHQIWEISFTLTDALNTGAWVKLLTCTNDGGLKIEGNKLYYYEPNTYKEIPGVTLTPGEKYTLRREVDFTDINALSSSYRLYDTTGKLVGSAENVSMPSISLPIGYVGFYCEELTTPVLIDDYKIYPIGVTTDLSVFDATCGRSLSTAEKSDCQQIAYRLSWTNATQEKQICSIVATRYNSSGAVLSETLLKAVEMAPGCNGVITGVVDNTQDRIQLRLEKGVVDLPPEPTAPPATEPTTAPTTAPSSVPTTEPTTAPTTEPATVPTTAPTAPTVTDPTTVPTTEPATVPATELTIVPTSVPTTMVPTSVTTAPTEETAPGGAENKSGNVLLWLLPGVLVLGGVGILLFKKKKS